MLLIYGQVKIRDSNHWSESFGRQVGGSRGVPFMIVGITGGTGFIGTSLLLRHIAIGDTVRLLSRRSIHAIALPNSVEVFHGDLMGTVESLIPFVDGVDVLYHCAGEIRDQMKMHSVHVTGTERLCAAANGRIGHWVQLSSVGVYGPQYTGIITEDTPPNPVGIYEKTKTESDELVMKAGKRCGFTYSVLRPSNVFGSSMTNQSLLQLIGMINKGLFFFIGKPGASANYIHVDNVAEGLVRCGRRAAAKGGIFNLSDFRTIEKFVKTIAGELCKPMPKLRLPEMPARWVAKLFGRLPRFPLRESRVNALTNRSVYSIERIQQELGYVHQLSMEDGLREMVKAWKRAK